MHRIAKSAMRAAGLTAAGLAATMLAACSAVPVKVVSGPPTVAETPGRARSADGSYIVWRERLIDDEISNGGIPIRGGDGLVEGDLDLDGFLDIVSVHEDSNHLRIAFGSADPYVWTLVTVAEGEIVRAIEDVAIGDLDGDGWPDLVAASEEAHLAFFRNPGGDVRSRVWKSHVPAITKGRGSWLRVFVADVTGDGRLDVLGANKGASDIIDPDALKEDRSTSLFTLTGNPLSDDSWHEQVLLRKGVPNTAMSVDIDGDGDIDVLAASRLDQQAFILENRGTDSTGKIRTTVYPLEIEPGSSQCQVSTSAFQADFADIDGDGRLDLITGVIENCGDARAPGGLPALGWIQQPSEFGQPWRYFRIGDLLPDTVVGIEVADFNGDGHLDVVTGGYSGLNIVHGGYTETSRDFDSPGVTASSTVGRIAWFQNPGVQGAQWSRHDISRRVRGMYDGFIARDVNEDGYLDIVATRGNSGSLDGVFWLEQLRSTRPSPAFVSDRLNDSAQLPLPPEDWLDGYEIQHTLVAPNKR